MINVVVVQGYVLDNAKAYIKEGKGFVPFKLKHTKRSYNKEEKENIYIEVHVGGKESICEHYEKHLYAGRLVAVTGELDIKENTYEDVTYYNPIIKARQVEFLSWAEKYNENDTDGE